MKCTGYSSCLDAYATGFLGGRFTMLSDLAHK